VKITPLVCPSVPVPVPFPMSYGYAALSPMPYISKQKKKETSGSPRAALCSNKFKFGFFGGAGCEIIIRTGYSYAGVRPYFLVGGGCCHLSSSSMGEVWKWERRMMIDCVIAYICVCGSSRCFALAKRFVPKGYWFGSFVVL